MSNTKYISPMGWQNLASLSRLLGFAIECDSKERETKIKILLPLYYDWDSNNVCQMGIPLTYAEAEDAIKNEADKKSEVQNSVPQITNIPLNENSIVIVLEGVKPTEEANCSIEGQSKIYVGTEQIGFLTRFKLDLKDDGFSNLNFDFCKCAIRDKETNKRIRTWIDKIKSMIPWANYPEEDF
jgi:hypothetical protein